MQQATQATTTQAMQAYEELVWRKGTERCERSYIQVQADKVMQAEQVMQADKVIQAEQVIQARTMQADAHRINTDGFRKVSTKREEANAKINDRYLVGQATQNPFMPNNNYVNDIEDQMNFLTPQKSG
jgi:hypothetical protein